MPNRFSTQAANADVMGQDAQAHGATEAMPQAIGAAGTPEDRTRRSDATAKKANAGESQEVEARPGKDINAAGFIKDKDAAKP